MYCYDFHSSHLFFRVSIDVYIYTQVADFGLAKLSQDNYTHVSTRVMGTFG